jgi:rhodanese-related sulfurtransferase
MSSRGIPGEELDRQIRAGTAPAVLDVRSRREYERGHVPGARHAPFWQLWSRALVRRLALRPSHAVVVYCGHGPRAYLAAGFLRRQGVRDIVLLDGHWAGWRRAGLPVERGRAHTP